MGLKLNNINSNNLNDINIKFIENEITTIISNNENSKIELLNILSGQENPSSGFIMYNKEKIELTTTCKKLNNYKENIYCIKDDYKNMLFNINVDEDIKYYIGSYDTESLKELLNSFGLNINILKKCYFELSDSEFRKILLIIGLMSKQKIIIFNYPTLCLDNKSIQTFIKKIKKIRRENKIIIINSNNSEFLLEISNRIIVINEQKIIADGNKYDILSNNKLLKKVDMKVPNILHFINKTKELKKINMGYRDNINDLIKDIFRYAK